MHQNQFVLRRSVN